MKKTCGAVSLNLLNQSDLRGQVGMYCLFDSVGLLIRFVPDILWQFTRIRIVCRFTGIARICPSCDTTIQRTHFKVSSVRNLGDSELSENTVRWHQYKRKFVSPDVFQHLFCSPVRETRRTGYISGPGFKAVWNIGRIHSL